MDERKLIYRVKQELDRTVRTISPELDKRLERALGRESAPDSPAKLFYLRPALAVAVIAAFAFSVGSLLSKQGLESSEVRAEGPTILSEFAKEFSRPTLVSKKLQPSQQAVLETARLHGRPLSMSQPSFIAASSEPALNTMLSMDPVSRIGVSGNTNSIREPLNVASAPSTASIFSIPSSVTENLNSSVIFNQTEPSSESAALGYQVQDRQHNFYISRERAGAVYRVLPGGRLKPVIQGLSRPRGLAFDQAGNLYIVESGTSRIWRMEQIDGALAPQTSRVFAENFRAANPAELSDLVINQDGDVFVSTATGNETVVYHISTKQPTPWWKFFCWYRC